MLQWLNQFLLSGNWHYSLLQLFQPTYAVNAGSKYLCAKVRKSHLWSMSLTTGRDSSYNPEILTAECSLTHALKTHLQSHAQCTHTHSDAYNKLLSLYAQWQQMCRLGMGIEGRFQTVQSTENVSKFFFIRTENWIDRESVRGICKEFDWYDERRWKSVKSDPIPRDLRLDSICSTCVSLCSSEAHLTRRE